MSEQPQTDEQGRPLPRFVVEEVPVDDISESGDIGALCVIDLWTDYVVGEYFDYYDDAEAHAAECNADPAQAYYI